MNIQAEKIELIRLITEIDSESLLKKIKAVVSAAKLKKADGASLSPAMIKRLEESKRQAAEGKIMKVNLDDIWK